MQRLYFIIVMTFVAVVGAFLWNTGNSGGSILSGFMGQSIDHNISTESGIVYFYGQECPHCHEVLDFLEENNIAEKVDFEKKEVWHNKDNSQQMMTKVEECGLSNSQVGVPFLYADGKCYIGTPDVLGFFSEEAGL